MCKPHWFLLALNTHTSEVVQKWWGSLCAMLSLTHSIKFSANKTFLCETRACFFLQKMYRTMTCITLKCTGKKNLQKNKEMAKNHEYYWINNQIMEQASLQNKEIKRFYVLMHAHMAWTICEKCCWRVLLKILAYLLYTLYLFSKF